MAHALPARPNLEWLKKTAKQHLRELRAANPANKLADAQLAVARRFGFSSWRALKVHIERPARSIDDDRVATFLRDVGAGRIDAIKATLAEVPAIVNAIGPHPYWGGRPQPLHVSIETNRRDVFDLLLETGADVNGNNALYDHWSPLMLTYDRERVDMRAALLARDVKDRWETTPIEAMSRLGPRGQPLVRHLLSRGITAPPEVYARTGDKRAIEAMLAANPRLIESEDLFMGAVEFSHHELAQWLLDRGANPNARSSIGSQGTGLHSAAWEGDLTMVKLLVAAGADLQARDREHNGTPEEWARISSEVTNNPRCREAAEYLAAVATGARR